VLVLDNLESNLDEGSRRFLDAEPGAFYRHLLTHLVGQSRLIVTSRYLPGGLTPLPPRVRGVAAGRVQRGGVPEIPVARAAGGAALPLGRAANRAVAPAAPVAGRHAALPWADSYGADWTRTCCVAYGRAAVAACDLFLKERDPAAFGRLLGLDRAPEVKTLRAASRVSPRRSHRLVITCV
jgi:hypothetical protein